MRIGFERFFIIFIGIAGIAIGILIGRMRKKKFALPVPLGPPGGTAFKPPYSVDFLMRIIKVMELAGIFGLCVAAAGPVFISSQMVWLNRGADILFVLDISPSMAGADMGGMNRFDASRALVEEFSRQRPSDAIGLIAVGDDAALLIPPTVDRQVLYERLKGLHIGDLGDGTALGMGLALGGLHLNNSRASRRSVILITDGENNAGSIHPETAAEILKRQGISLWIIGVGSTGEVPIDYVDPHTRVRRTGTFDSRFSIEKLNTIARAGGGRLITAPTAEAFAFAFSEVNAAEITIRRPGTINKREPFHVPIILVSIFLIAAGRVIKRFVLGACL